MAKNLKKSLLCYVFLALMGLGYSGNGMASASLIDKEECSESSNKIATEDLSGRRGVIKVDGVEFDDFTKLPSIHDMDRSFILDLTLDNIKIDVELAEELDKRGLTDAVTIDVLNCILEPGIFFNCEFNNLVRLNLKGCRLSMTDLHDIMFHKSFAGTSEITLDLSENSIYKGDFGSMCDDDDFFGLDSGTIILSSNYFTDSEKDVLRAVKPAGWKIKYI